MSGRKIRPDTDSLFFELRNELSCVLTRGIRRNAARQSDYLVELLLVGQAPDARYRLAALLRFIYQKLRVAGRAHLRKVRNGYDLRGAAYVDKLLCHRAGRHAADARVYLVEDIR